MSMYSVVQYVREKDAESGDIVESTSVVLTTDDLNAALVRLHTIKAYFWNESNIYMATAKIMDERLVEYHEPEQITHPEPQPEPPEPEEITEG